MEGQVVISVTKGQTTNNNSLYEELQLENVSQRIPSTKALCHTAVVLLFMRVISIDVTTPKQLP